jgi:hypothetical protein
MEFPSAIQTLNKEFMNTEEVASEVKRKVSKLNPERGEGKVAKAIESQTSRIPSDFFLWSAVGVMAGSLALQLMKKKHAGLFVGQWAAPVLLMGVYNKIVKLEGHDQDDMQPA